jgi:hypothetical protein
MPHTGKLRSAPPGPTVDLSSVNERIAKIRAHVASAVLEAEWLVRDVVIP